MRIKQTGFFVPLFVAIVLIIAAALMPHSPSVQVTDLQKLRFQHSMWWFWQQAVADYYRKFDVWPDSIEDLVSTYAIDSAPSYISGFADAEGFRVRWSNLTADEKALLANGLTHSKVEFHEDGIDAILRAETLSAVVDGIYRNQEVVMESDISMSSYDINQVRDIYLTQVSVTQPSEVDHLRATQSLMQWLSIDAVVGVDKIAPMRWQIDELDKLMAEINSLFTKLEAHMQQPPDGPSPY
ncbi:hypothetical protein [Pseudidiomarina andamanensis]|uniref:Uncharacterized protein n=1 Tax=Pseudidiomarina andamanensis TaxID=1940690 RepID=A0AA92ILP8_9GAMM|nr:hypothetical protein [Pseudidiomarina andamanensis]MDS0219694.1 hypothetical protein [Pseudidiomarina andamanensis]QGT95686.1 hypothetical protein D3795_05665 [Pseudidiomarina andamanensis]